MKSIWKTYVLNIDFTALFRCLDAPNTVSLLYNLENEEERNLLAVEQEVLERARAVEVVFALNRRNKLPEGVELCFSQAVEDMLRQPEHFHLYHKYFQVTKTGGLLLFGFLIDTMPYPIGCVILNSFTNSAHRLYDDSNIW